MQKRDDILTGRAADGGSTDIGKHTGVSSRADAPGDELTEEAERRAHADEDPHAQVREIIEEYDPR